MTMEGHLLWDEAHFVSGSFKDPLGDNGAYFLISVIIYKPSRGFLNVLYFFKIVGNNFFIIVASKIIIMLNYDYVFLLYILPP